MLSSVSYQEFPGPRYQLTSTGSLASETRRVSHRAHLPRVQTLDHADLSERQAPAMSNGTADSTV